MKKLSALQTLQASGKEIFSSADLQKLLQTSTNNYANIFAGKLVNEGVLERVSKGYYILVSDKPSDFKVANILYRPSYISLESALSYYGIMIQSPQQVTSISTKRATIRENKGKTFSYVHLDQKYFTGYQRIEGFLIATPEKALVDTMFFVALGKASLSIEELNLELIDIGKVEAFASTIINRAFNKYFKAVTL